MAEMVFLGLLAAVAYCYLGYPVLLMLLGAMRKFVPATGGELPTVSLVIVAHNEEDVITEKIENSLALNYPREKLEIVVASDASTDGTDTIVKSFEFEGVRLVRRPTRGSQTGAQNYAVPRTSGEIIVFSDANSMYRPDALNRLVAPFFDPRVGSVVGRLRHSNPDSTAVSFGEELYWRYEAFLKRAQSAASALLLANGAIYGVRRSLYEPVHPTHDHDTIVPLRVAGRGFRVVYQPDAVAFEEAGESFRGEFKRKVRIIIRDLWTLIDLRLMLVPFRPWLAFHLLSHKVMRWAVGFGLVGILVSNLFLLDHPLYRATLLGQFIFYAAALLSFRFEKREGGSALLRVPLYFCLVNGAGIAAFLAVLFGRRMTTWNPRSW